MWESAVPGCRPMRPMARITGPRRMLAERDQTYVLAVRNNPYLRFIDEEGFVVTDPAEMAGDLDDDA